MKKEEADALEAIIKSHVETINRTISNGCFRNGYQKAMAIAVEEIKKKIEG